MKKEFKVHILSEVGIEKSKHIATAFDCCLDSLESVVPDSAEFTICKRKLEEACFYAKKAMAQQPCNQNLSRN